MKSKEIFVLFIIFLILLSSFPFNDENGFFDSFISSCEHSFQNESHEGEGIIMKSVNQAPNLTELDPIFKFEEHVDKVTSVTFSPDGGFIASGSADGSLVEWDLHN
jgi:WD40 repeat protein